jgi:hypothetical protein
MSTEAIKRLKDLSTQIEATLADLRYLNITQNCDSTKTCRQGGCCYGVVGEIKRLKKIKDRLEHLL